MIDKSLFNFGSIQHKLSFLHWVAGIDPHCHSIHLLSYNDLAGHSRSALVVVLCCQQHIKLLLRRNRQSLVEGLDVDSAGGAGKLFVAESEDVGILVDCAVGHVHEIVTWVFGCLPTLHSMGVCCRPRRTKIVMVLRRGVRKLFSSFASIG